MRRGAAKAGPSTAATASRIAPRGVSLCALLLAAVAACPRAAPAGDFAGVVLSTKPIAYFRLESADGASEIGASTYRSDDGHIREPGVAPGMAQNHYARFDGHDDSIATTLLGGVDQAGSIMAWVQLSKLPSSVGHSFFIAGEPQAERSFDLQIDQDDVVRFFHGTDQPLAFAPDKDSLIGQWHMLAAAVDAHNHTAVIYWDGKAVSRASPGAITAPRSAFCIGGGKSLPDRYFAGGIDEVAVWDHALSADQDAMIYAAIH